jgi:hypothetical protein
MGPFEHASVQVNFGHMGYEDARRSMQLFAAEVLPDFLPAHAAPPRKAQAG